MKTKQELKTRITEEAESNLRWAETIQKPENFDKFYYEDKVISLKEKFGEPFIFLGGIVLEETMLAVYGTYALWMNEPKFLNEILHNIDLFKIGVIYELYPTVEFMVVENNDNFIPIIDNKLRLEALKK